MNSILKFNPNTNNYLENSLQQSNTTFKENRSSKIFRNGMSIMGFWKNEKLEGEAILQFQNSKTEMKGFFSEGQLLSGSITFESGVRIECEFHPPPAIDMFSTITFFFQCKWYFKGQFGVNGKLIKGSLYNQTYKIMATWKGLKLVKYIDEAKRSGIVISESSFYEGGIQENEFSENGIEYLPFGLVYYEWVRSGRDFNGKMFKFFYHLDNQYQTEVIYDDGNLVQFNEVHANGANIEYPVKIGENIKAYKITFKETKQSLTLFAEATDWFFPSLTRGFLKINQNEINVNFKQENMNFEIHESAKIYSVQSFIGKIKNGFVKESLPQKSVSGCPKHVKNIKQESYTFDLEKTRENCLIKDNDSQKIEFCQNCKNNFDKYKNYKSESRKLKEKIIKLELKVEELENSAYKNEKISEIMQPIKDNFLKLNDLLYFKGTLINNLKNGFCEEFSKCEYFNGFYENGKKSGEGELMCSDFEFRGDFENDKFQGNGVKSFPQNSKKLIGKFHQNAFLGEKASLFSCDYLGKIVDEKLNGPGKLTFVNSFEFYGFFENDKIINGKNINRLVNTSSGREYLVNFKFSDDLSSDVFVGQMGDVFTVDFKKGIVLKIK